MRIRFGLHLDGLDPTPPTTRPGEVTLGPQGLIGVLETDLGLAPVLDHPAEALMAYRGCLLDADDLTRFYHNSFGVDPINVARMLLDWRAQWYEAGWDGTFPRDASARLRDMADVEAFARDRVPFSNGQRLQRIAADLGGRRTQIDELILLDDPAELPVAWQAVLDHLQVEIGAGVKPNPQAAAGTDLHTVQARLVELANRPEGEALGKTALNSDGSFLVLRAVSRDISARAVAESLRGIADPSGTVVIAERDGIIIDNAFERSALPRCGFQHYSRFRAVSQVLKLCLALLWEPIKPHLLLQFLIHPLGPVPGHVRRALADAVASEPGIGGRAWGDAIDRIRPRAGESDSRVRDTISYWFESPRFPVDGAPLTTLTDRTQRCANWLSTRLAMVDEAGEQAMFASAYAQADALMRSLAQLADRGQSTLPKIELDRLLDEVTRQQPDPNTFAEAGRVRATTHPATVTEAFSQVIWWDLSAANSAINATHELQSTWSRSELGELARQGVVLAGADQQLAWRGARWRRPILNARERFILVVHDAEAGYHPLWSQLSNVFSDWAEVRLDETLLQGTADVLAHLDIATVAVPVQPLPAPRRWWDLPAQTALKARDLESYSSLSKLFFHPHEWALTYSARLRKGRADDLPDGPLLYGSLAHRLFENFFDEHQNWREMDGSAVTAWLDSHLPGLIAREAALLLEPGRGVDRQQVSAILERALARLLSHLRAADIQQVRTEHQEEQPYLDVRVRGAIDLLLVDANGQEIVVDAKWGGESYRGKELEANRHLQLATYAYMRKTATGANRWPYAAYFIITTGNLLAPDDSVFTDAVVRAPTDGEGLADLFSRGEASYRWRRAQLDAGQIEVNAHETEPSERSAAPLEALDNDAEPDRFDDFTRLTGWNSFS